VTRTVSAAASAPRSLSSLSLRGVGGLSSPLSSGCIITLFRIGIGKRARAAEEEEEKEERLARRENGLRMERKVPRGNLIWLTFPPVRRRSGKKGLFRARQANLSAFSCLGREKKELERGLLRAKAAEEQAGVSFSLATNFLPPTLLMAEKGGAIRASGEQIAEVRPPGGRPR